MSKRNLITIVSLALIFAPIAFGQIVRQDIAADGFTWLEAVSTEEVGPNNIPVSTGWALKSWIRISGNYPNQSAFKIVVSKSGKSIATTRCETFVYRRSGTDVDESFTQTAECWQSKSATKEMVSAKLIAKQKGVLYGRNNQSYLRRH